MFTLRVNNQLPTKNIIQIFQTISGLGVWLYLFLSKYLDVEEYSFSIFQNFLKKRHSTCSETRVSGSCLTPPNLQLLPINGRVCANGSNWRSHVLQVPHLDGAIVTSRHHVVPHCEHGWCHSAERNKWIVNGVVIQSLFNTLSLKISPRTNEHGFHKIYVKYLNGQIKTDRSIATGSCRGSRILAANVKDSNLILSVSHCN